MLHAHDTPESFVVDVLEDISIVNLSGRWFFAAGIVTDLEVGDLAPRTVDVRDEIAFVNLLVIAASKWIGSAI